MAPYLQPEDVQILIGGDGYARTHYPAGCGLPLEEEVERLAAVFVVPSFVPLPEVKLPPLSWIDLAAWSTFVIIIALVVREFYS